MAATPFHATAAELLVCLPGPGGERFASALERGSLTVEIYAPHGNDPQRPHTRDEIYVVVRGSARFVCDGARRPVGPGDVLFIPAGLPHRFEEFGDDLVVWGIFFPSSVTAEGF